VWGCDAPSPEPQFYVDPCTGCDGTDAACAGCRGTGRETIYRCPVLALPEIAGFLNVYLLYRKGFLPEPGGSLDQPNAFVEACLELDQMIADLIGVSHA